MIAPANPEPPNGGQGEILDPHHAREHGKMYDRAIRNGWIRHRWPIDKPEDELRAEYDQKPSLSAAEKAMVATHDLLNSPKPEHYAQGARLSVSMNSQNQKDQHHEEGEHVEHSHTHEVRAVRQEVLGDPAYLEYARKEAQNGNGEH